MTELTPVTLSRLLFLSAFFAFSFFLKGEERDM
jgi:hypothetical protein